MAKQYLLLFFLTISTHWASGQVSSADLRNFNEKRLHLTKIGMLSLGGWAVGNMAVSGFSLNNASGANKHFHQMNVYWNVVNLALAGFGYYGALKTDPGSLDVYNSLKEQYSLEKILLLNTGLDVTYVLSGLYLTERAKNAPQMGERLKGFGQSVMLQGSFLLLFDTVLFLIHNGHGQVFKSLLNNVSLTGFAPGVTLRF